MKDKPADRVIKRIRAERGLAVRVADACGIHRVAVYQWERVPIKRVFVVAKMLDMAPEQIRPDVFRKTHNHRR
jgi:hypothetical protein